MAVVPPEAKNIADVATRVREVLLLGSAALEETTAFATSAQGTTADSALQPAAIGVTIQAYDADLAAIAALESAADKAPYATGVGTWAMMDATVTGRSVLAATGPADIRNILDTSPYVADLTTLKALDTTKDIVAYFDGSNWDWDATIPIATHQADTQEGIYVAPSAVLDGAWVRRFEGTAFAPWFGVVLNNPAVDSSTEIQATLDMAELLSDNARLPGGSLYAASLNLSSGTVLSGYRLAQIVRNASGNILSGVGADNVSISDVSFDMARATVADDGQGISLTGDDIRISSVDVTGFSKLSTGGGTGVLVYSDNLLAKSNRVRFENLTLIGHTNAAALETFGWIFADVDYSFASHIYSENIHGNATAYGHELKNTSNYNNLHALTTKYGLIGLGYGQETVGLEGPKGNVAYGIVSAQMDIGILCGDTTFSTFSTFVHDAAGSPGHQPKYSVVLTEASTGNVLSSGVSFGDVVAAVRLRGAASRNVIEIAAHVGTGKIAEIIEAGTERNFINVLHPGSYLTIAGNYTDTSGGTLKGSTANVIHCPVTGERHGSISGRYWDKLGNSGAAVLSSYTHVMENDTSFRQAGLTPTGQSFGISHSTPARTDTASFAHVSNATATNEYWEMKTGGVSSYRWFTTVFRVVTDIAADIGAAAYRFKDAYIQQLRPGAGTVIWTSGAGTPEGSVTAVVGSLYTRTDGGAGTTLYVKETGTGNTGWVAK